jgi:hypothetical protein
MMGSRHVFAAACAALLAMLLLSACGSDGSAGDSGASASGEAVAATETEGASTAPAPSQEPFSSYVEEFKPPEDEYKGPLFELSQDYPPKMPRKSEMPIFFNTDFRQDWRTYMSEARDYCFEGNTEVEWKGQKNKVRSWLNMPWQDFGPSGREAIHGLTQEASIRPFQLAKSQIYGQGDTYAVGFYNEFGGYAIGQVWKDHHNPDPEYASTKGFPEGTVVCKLLFVSIPPEIVAQQIPFLANPIQWEAYVGVPSGPGRAVQKVTLIQMDLMVRDERAPAGWIFGTYQYNGELNSRNRWQNLIPVGLTWGNDPDQTDDIPVENSQHRFPSPQKLNATPINDQLDETVVNPDASELPTTHLGWNGRLNGPVDNLLSSCMSCHMTASSPERPLSPMFLSTPENRPPSSSPEWNDFWMQWFQNVGWKNHKLEKFKEAKYALDFSLQLSAALQNFYLAEEQIKPVNPVRR